MVWISYLNTWGGIFFCCPDLRTQCVNVSKNLLKIQLTSDLNWHRWRDKVYPDSKMFRRNHFWWNRSAMGNEKRYLNEFGDSLCVGICKNSLFFGPPVQIGTQTFGKLWTEVGLVVHIISNNSSKLGLWCAYFLLNYWWWWCCGRRRICWTLHIPRHLQILL